jgi:hypothetical protein
MGRGGEADFDAALTGIPPESTPPPPGVRRHLGPTSQGGSLLEFAAQIPVNGLARGGCLSDFHPQSDPHPRMTWPTESDPWNRHLCC